MSNSNFPLFIRMLNAPHLAKRQINAQNASDLSYLSLAITFNASQTTIRPISVSPVSRSTLSSEIGTKTPSKKGYFFPLHCLSTLIRSAPAGTLSATPASAVGGAHALCVEGVFKLAGVPRGSPLQVCVCAAIRACLRVLQAHRLCDRLPTRTCKV